MVRHLVRSLFAVLLAAASAVLGGCVLTGLTAGITLAPPGGYVQIASFDEHKATPGPVKIIPVELAPAVVTTAPTLDIRPPTPDAVHAVP